MNTELTKREKRVKLADALPHILRRDTRAIGYSDDNPCWEWLCEALDLMMNLTDEQRLSVMNQFCKHCGGDDPRCQCWNDE